MTDSVTSLLHAVDTLDWDGVLAVLADEVRLDYTSLWGGSPETVAGPEVVARWRALLPGFDATQHLTGPVLADGDRRTTTVRGYHHLVDGERRSTWMVAGWYDVRVSGDRIAAITLHATYEEGDRALTEAATARCEAGAGGRVA
ncbi:nuclear transport factor 2 family protein [Jiangella sp. DSM 45060]|uniref:nuclear transport factor 2 family protein n=1 Tax=Jiangella sp. DSM 45060 TaxID=1798224 RepID=UPI00087DB6E4|nr:nuclear transport factor 2 family protein [Jiangella sp. DSM 45060]SDS39241.1 SnoaL-like domain-containing protein [Jiangella sp. DSM 45060]